MGMGPSAGVHRHGAEPCVAGEKLGSNSQYGLQVLYHIQSTVADILHKSQKKASYVRQSPLLSLYR